MPSPAPTPAGPRAGAVLATISAFCAAAFFIPYKAATAHAPPAVLVIALLAPAAALNSLAALATGRGQLRVAAHDVRVAAILAVFTVAGNVCMVEALALIDAGVTSVIMQTQVFFVAFSGWLLLRERITLRFAIGAVIAVAGVVLTRLNSLDGASAGLLGTVYALGAAVSFALTHVITRKHIDRIHPVSVNALRLWLSVGVLLLLPGRAVGAADMPGRAWLLGAVAAMFGPFAARLSIMFAVRHIPASAAVLFGLLTPVFAFAMEIPVLGSSPAPLELAGAAAILIGVAVPVVWKR